MSNQTGIQWTDATWNPVTGCDKVSPGCAHCYAEGIAVRLWPTQYPPVSYTTCSAAAGCVHTGGDCAPFVESRPREFTDVMCHEDRLDQPLRWKKPRRIFVNSMSDLFHEDVPDAFIDKVFAVMALAPQHTFQVLTKRADRMRAYLADENDRDRIGIRISRAVADLTRPIVGPRGRNAEADWNAHCDHVAEWTWRKQDPFVVPNVWLGVSVENQHFADERIPLLLQTPAAVRFISAEPLLGPVDLVRSDALAIEACVHTGATIERGLDWVIVGGESGNGARPFDVSWARSIVAQCKSAGVACFVKQLGADAKTPLGGRFEFRDKKGGDMREWPEDLQVREFPSDGGVQAATPLTDSLG